MTHSPAPQYSGLAVRRLLFLLVLAAAGYLLYAYVPAGKTYLDLRFHAQKLANVTALEGRKYTHTAQSIEEIHRDTGLRLYSRNIQILQNEGMITVTINATLPVDLPGLQRQLEHDISARGTAPNRKRAR